MSLSGFLPAVSRRAMALGTVAALASVASVGVLQAQATSTPPASGQTPAAAAAPADPLTFTSATARMVFISLTADAGAAMEDALKRAKEAIAKPDAKPEAKQQAAHWKVLKSTEANGDVSLFFVLDPTVPNVSYNPFKAVYDSGADRTVIDPLFARVNGGIKGLKYFENYSMLIDMSGGGGH